MLKLILALSITLLAGQAFGADYRYSVPLPRPAPVKHLDATVPHLASYQVAALHIAQAVNPDPFNARGQSTSREPAQASTSQPIVVPAPVIDTTPGLLSWILTGIGALAGGSFGFNQLKQSMTKKPEVNDLLLRIIESGKAGDLVQGVAGTVPFAGTAFSVLRPMIKEVLTDVLEQRGVAPRQTGGTAPSPSAPTYDALEQWKADLLQQVGNIVQNRIEAALAKRTVS